MTRISVLPDDPGYKNSSRPGLGHTVDIHLDGVWVPHLQTVDDERGFVDVYRVDKGVSSLHRLWGKVEIVYGYRNRSLPIEVLS